MNVMYSCHGHCYQCIVNVSHNFIVCNYLSVQPYKDFTGTLDRVQLKDYFSSCISELAIPVLNLIFCIKTRLAFLISCVLGKEASEGEGGETCTAFACSFISTVDDIELLPNNTGQHHLGQTGSCKLSNYGSH